VNQLKLFKIREKFWLIVAVASVLYACYIAIFDSLRMSAVPFILSALATSLYFSRRFMRRRYERYLQSQNNEK
jgi:hypothetical protein